MCIPSRDVNYERNNLYSSVKDDVILQKFNRCFCFLLFMNLSVINIIIESSVFVSVRKMAKWK